MRQLEPEGQKPGLFSRECPPFPKAILVAPAPSQVPWEKDGRSTNTRPMGGRFFCFVFYMPMYHTPSYEGWAVNEVPAKLQNNITITREIAIYEASTVFRSQST